MKSGIKLLEQMTDMTLEKAIAQAKAENIRNWFGFNTNPEAIAVILNAAASGDLIPKADHKPVAWKYRWKIDGEYVGWRYSDASNAHPSLDGFEEVPLYETVPDHKLAVAQAYQRAAAYSDKRQDHDIAAGILALADADALAEVQALKAERDDCAIYLKDGETPRQRMDRDHADVLALMEMLAKDRSRRDAAEAEVQKMRAALSTLNDKDMCQMGQAPCDWALRLIAEKEAAEAEAVYLRAEVRELKDTIMDLKSELNWIKDRYDA